MATTDPTLAATALDILASESIPFAVLHSEESIINGNATSDIDLVVGCTPYQMLGIVTREFHRVGLYPVVLWPYDVADTATLLLATEDGSDGVQLDLLCDRAGLGHYGIRSGRILEMATDGRRWPTACPDHELLYSIRKRHWKGQHGRLLALAGEGRRGKERLSLQYEAQQLFERRVADQVSGFLTGEAGRFTEEPALPAGYRIRNFNRRFARLRRPVGFWVDLSEHFYELSRVADIAARFGRFLPTVGWGSRPRGMMEELAWGIREVAPVRWRAGLYASWSDSPGRLRPDLVLAGSDAGETDRRIVAEMEKRLLDGAVSKRGRE